jgi:hypothetical protein
MNELYRMTEQQRQKYLLLLFSGREQQATDFREECDSYWRSHPEEWEQSKSHDSTSLEQ